MIISDNLYKVDTSAKALERISHLNKKRGQLIQARSFISKQMAKSYLDYCGITKDAWNWKFQAVYNDEMEQARIDEATGEEIKMPVTKCKFQSAEQMYQMPYTPLEIVRDKVDEYIRDVTSRRHELETLSVPYANHRYIISHLVKEPYKTPEFQEALKQAVFDASVKTTGFLRPVIYDIEKEVSQPVIKKVDGRNTVTFETSKQKVKLGLKIESVDPETVFIDPAASDPKECFIITPYETEELIDKFPMLSKYIPGVERLTGQKEDDQTPETTLKKESLYNYHIGEMLAELYELGDLRFLYYLSDSYFDGIDFNSNNSISNGLPEFTAQGTSSLLFSKDNAGNFFDSMLNFTLPEERRRHSYFVTEYYNINYNTYCVYIGNILLLETSIMEPFRDLPLVPIYANKKKRGYYGTPLTKYFSNFQDEYNTDNHSQKLSTLITGKTTMLINDSAISELYHPDRQITIEKNSPLTTIHVTEMSVDNGIPMGTPITPINTTTGTSENILETRKNSILNNMERQFPTIKTLSAASNQEAQNDVIWSRDLLSNEFITSVSTSLEKLAYKIFPSRLLEMKLLSEDLSLSIPVDLNKPDEAKIRIESTKKKLEDSKTKKIAELKKLYEGQIEQAKEQIKADPQAGGQVAQQVQQQITNEVVQGFLEKTGAQLPEDPAQAQALLQQIPQDPDVAKVISEQMQTVGMQMIDAKITDMASQQVPVPQDLDIYFSFEDLDKLTELQKKFKFSFKKSQKEIQASMNNFIQTIKPFEQFTPYNINLVEFLKMAIENAGYNPTEMLMDKPPSPIDISRAEQTRRTEIVSYDKIPAVFARFLNDQAGQELFTEDSLIESMRKMQEMETNVKAQEIQVRGQVKAQTDMIKESNKAQINTEMSNADMVRQQAINEASQPPLM